MDPGSQGFDKVFTTVKPRKNADPKADAHHVKEITDRSIAFIQANKDKPFFCYVAHNSIHTPRMEDPALVAKYRAKTGSKDPKNDPVIGAMLETLDRHIGRILDTLDELDLAENTLVVYFADNGSNLAEKELKPLRGVKAQIYEGGIRVPLLFRWPDVIKAGTKCAVPVISVDFFPTFVQAAALEVTAPAVDGVSLLPLLKQRGKLNREAIYWHFPHYHSAGIGPCGAIRMGKYKLIEWYEKSIEGINSEGALELFNLKEDISEQNNLVKKKPKITAQLYRKLKAWRKSAGAQEMVKNPDYDRRKI